MYMYMYIKKTTSNFTILGGSCLYFYNLPLFTSWQHSVEFMTVLNTLWMENTGLQNTSSA